MAMQDSKRKINMPIERPPASAVYRNQWRRAPLRRVYLAVLPFRERSAQRQSVSDLVNVQMRSLATQLTLQHPDISTDPGIYGGNPHIKDVRLTVGNVLAKLYVYGNTKAVAEIYAPHVNEAQIKEAIAYAQDFLEAAIHPHQALESDG